MRGLVDQKSATTQLQLCSLERSPDIFGIQWLFHGDPLRSEVLLLPNGATLVRRNTLNLSRNWRLSLRALWVCCSSTDISPLIAEPGSKFAAKRGLAFQHAPTHHSSTSQVWRLISCFDVKAIGIALASALSALCSLLCGCVQGCLRL